MDTQKIGRFLKALRKEKGLTQEQLGEWIGVTNKTVSRWETGNYLPPVECLTRLSDIYGVSINEIIVGERLDFDNFTAVADENLSEVLEQNIEDSAMKKIMLISSVVQLVIGIAAIISFAILLINGEDSVSWIPAFVLSILFVVRGIIGIADYRPKK